MASTLVMKCSQSSIVTKGNIAVVEEIKTDSTIIQTTPDSDRFKRRLYLTFEGGVNATTDVEAAIWDSSGERFAVAKFNLVRWRLFLAQNNLPADMHFFLGEISTRFDAMQPTAESHPIVAPSNDPWGLHSLASLNLALGYEFIPSGQLELRFSGQHEDTVLKIDRDGGPLSYRIRLNNTGAVRVSIPFTYAA